MRLIVLLFVSVVFIGCESEIKSSASKELISDRNTSTETSSVREYNAKAIGILMRLAATTTASDQESLIEELTLLEQSSAVVGTTSPFFLPLDSNGLPVQWEYSHNLDAVHSFIVSDISRGPPSFDAFRFDVRSKKVVEVLRKRRFTPG